jgi:hypothetical protein
MATMFRASLMAFVILLAGSAAQAEEENGVHASLSGVNMWYTDSGGSGCPSFCCMRIPARVPIG